MTPKENNSLKKFVDQVEEIIYAVPELLNTFTKALKQKGLIQEQKIVETFFDLYSSQFMRGIHAIETDRSFQHIRERLFIDPEPIDLQTFGLYEEYRKLPYNQDGTPTTIDDFFDYLDKKARAHKLENADELKDAIYQNLETQCKDADEVISFELIKYALNEKYRNAGISCIPVLEAFFTKVIDEHRVTLAESARLLTHLISMEHVDFLNQKAGLKNQSRFIFPICEKHSANIVKQENWFRIHPYFFVSSFAGKILHLPTHYKAPRPRGD